jgi:hypothetical protein
VNGVLLFGGCMAYFCETLSVRVIILFLGCTWILIMGAWQESHTGHNNLTKLNMITSSIWLRFLRCVMSHGFGRTYHHWGTFHFTIFKNKTPDVKFLLEQIHSKFYYHIITCNHLEKDHAFATHKFKVLGWDIFS